MRERYAYRNAGSAEVTSRFIKTTMLFAELRHVSLQSKDLETACWIQLEDWIPVTGIVLE